MLRLLETKNYINSEFSVFITGNLKMLRDHSRDPGRHDDLCRREAFRGELCHDPSQSLEKQPRSGITMHWSGEVSESFFCKEDSREGRGVYNSDP